MRPPARAFNIFLSDTTPALEEPELPDRVLTVAPLCHLSPRTERAYSERVSIHLKRQVSWFAVNCYFEVSTR